MATNSGATPLFHSDRGYQYTSKAFRQRILAAGMTQSMSCVARCIDNGPMEGFCGLMKREMYYNFLLKIYGLYFKRTEPYKYINDENSILNQMIHNRDEIIAQYEEVIIAKSDEIVSKLSRDI